MKDDGNSATSTPRRISDYFENEEFSTRRSNFRQAATTRARQKLTHEQHASRGINSRKSPGPMGVRRIQPAIRAAAKPSSTTSTPRIPRTELNKSKKNSRPR